MIVIMTHIIHNSDPYSEWCNSLSVSLSISTAADVSSSVAANTCPDITLYRE